MVCDGDWRPGNVWVWCSCAPLLEDHSFCGFSGERVDPQKHTTKLTLVICSLRLDTMWAFTVISCNETKRTAGAGQAAQ